MSLVSYLAVALAVTLVINIVLFLVAYKRQTDRLTDGAYAISFASMTLYALFSQPLVGRRPLIAGLVLLWALRLGGFLVYRIWKSGKDKRFDAWRSNFWLLGRFWVLQGITAWVVLLPTLFALHANTIKPSLLITLGVFIWGIGFSLESTADIQKYRFNANPKNAGQWIAEGVWRWSRHPNYFGEIMVWSGIYVATFSSLSGAQRLIGLVSPLFIAGILLFATGIPILEKQADERWGSNPAYREYKRRTSILIPRPPRSV